MQWMDEPGPTDVLASRWTSCGPGRDDGEPAAGPARRRRALPDGRRRSRPRQAGHTTEDELHLLTMHGVLHLLGYDHAEPEEEREMFGLQGGCC